MKSFYNLRSKQYYSAKMAKLYGRDGPTGEKYKVYYDTITGKCLQAGNNFSVLEFGCGTGRYFFYLSNVQRLVGVDLSEHMLEAARENLKRIPELLPVTDFVHSRIEDFNTDEKFDLIYSIGTLGEYCGFNEKLLEQIVSFLKPNGLFFCTLVDADSYVKRPIGLKRKLFRVATKWLPLKLRSKIDGWAVVDDDFKDLYLSTEQVKTILSSSRIPITWELSKARDNLHMHHIVKISPKVN